jgi:hypothetical protein
VSYIYRCAALPSQRSACSLPRTAIRGEGTRRVFAESITANRDIALADLQGVDYIRTDVLGVLDELQSNCAILSYVQMQRIAQQRAKSSKSGRRST